MIGWHPRASVTHFSIWKYGEFLRGTRRERELALAP